MSKTSLNFIRFGTFGNKLRIFDILSCTRSFRVNVGLVGGEMKHESNRNLLTNLFKLIKVEVIVKNDELHKILDFFRSAVTPFTNLPLFSVQRSCSRADFGIAGSLQ